MTVDRSLLPHTFAPWFGRFDRLTEVQQQAIPAILTGHDVLICSATASGKTEAFAAPAAEMVRQHRLGPASVLIIAPTRALSNDLKRRLDGPMGLVEVSFGRYTGEHKERVDGRLPSIAVATPEALDSLLARRPHALRDTRLVILDEIHVLDNTPRGDQLRVLLHRLDGVTTARAQRVAASATVDRPAELAARYLRDAELVLVPGLRHLRARAFDGRGPAAMAAHLDDLAGHGIKKVLVFCRSRNGVETFAAKLPGMTRFDDAVFAHHGSLAKGHRERTERLFLQAPAAVCFATLTLEMGIDIGTVDYVMLADLPSDVPSLLQRVGRGGRRGGWTRFGYLIESAAEGHLFRTMTRLGKEGRLCAGAYGFRPSVLVQQALVQACAGAYLCEGEFEASIPPELRAELGADAARSLLNAMVEGGVLEKRGSDRFVASDAIEQRYTSGTLHSNIDDTPGVDVIDRLTGEVVGTIGGADTRRIEVGGRNRQIVKTSDDRVLTDSAPGASPARFRPSGSPSVSFALGRAVVESLGVAPDAVGLCTIAGVTTLLHGFGSIGLLLLLERLQKTPGAPGVREQSPYTLTLSSPLAELPECSPAQLSAFLEKRVDGLAKLLQMGPWKKQVPEDLHLSAVRRLSGLDEVVAFLTRTRVQVIEEPGNELAAVLRDL
jgi:ATP-dependent helicase Lhr and Lhr-like helicase